MCLVEQVQNVYQPVATWYSQRKEQNSNDKNNNNVFELGVCCYPNINEN